MMQFAWYWLLLLLPLPLLLRWLLPASANSSGKTRRRVKIEKS